MFNMKKSNWDNGEKIFIPNILSIEDIEFVLEKIVKYQQGGKIKQGDYILVDELNKEINIKVFIGKVIDGLASKNKVTPKEIIMAFMRDQNKEIPRLRFKGHKIIKE